MGRLKQHAEHSACYIVSKMNGDATMLEICSSDTHSTSGKRTRVGYFALGTTTSPDKIAACIISFAPSNRDGCGSAFELACAQSAIKVMGKKQFEDYSTALDRSLNVTKIFVAITVASFIAMLALA